jgi:multidrug efflux pump subunit AcrB
VIVAYRNGAPVRVRDIGRAVAAATDSFAAAYHNDAQAILLSVYKQPGANIIDTVEQIKSLLPKLTANIPAAIRVDTVLDRTTTIRASVLDVEFTLVLTVGLVVLVVLLFLRNLWATLVPAITIVLSLLGSFAAMYAFNFSIDNLSLMALTIAIGFVVDDAIVEVENVYRHIEQGSPPLQAALVGSGEIRFTVLSISVSLIAVFIPLLLMSGIIGRLFREFALTVTASIVVSAFVSLTLAPMLCSRFLRHQSDRHGRLYRIIEAGFDALLSGYRRTLDVVLRHQAVTLGVFFATMVLSVLMMIQIPKGFFPIQDTGMLNGLAEAAQEVSPVEMMRLQRELGAVLLRDPDIAGFASQTGSTGGNGNAQSANTARFFIALKPREERTLTASQIINRLRPQFARVEGANMFLQATQDITVGGRAARGSFQYTLQDANIPELVEWSEKMLAKMRTLPQLADASTDLLAIAPRLRVTINRDQASLRHHAADDRRHAQRRVRAASGDAILHTAQYLLCHPRNHPRPAGVLCFARPHLREIAPDRRGAAAVGARYRRYHQGRPAFGVAPGPVPGGYAVVQPASRHRARPGGRRHPRGSTGHRPPGLGHRHLPGQRPGVPEFPRQHAGVDRRGAGGRLHHSRHAV